MKILSTSIGLGAMAMIQTVKEIEQEKKNPVPRTDKYIYTCYRRGKDIDSLIGTKVKNWEAGFVVPSVIGTEKFLGTIMSGQQEYNIWASPSGERFWAQQNE